MTKRVIQNPVMLRDSDFDIPSSTRAYPLGEQVTVVDANSATTIPYSAVYEYCQAGTTLQQYGIYAIQSTASGVVAGISTSSVTSAGYGRVIVPQTAVTNGYYFFGAVKGVCTAAATAAAGQNMSAGNQYKIVNAATTLGVATVSQAAGTTPTLIRQTNAVGFASGLSATSANSVSVYLYGDAVIYNQPTTLL